MAGVKNKRQSESEKTLSALRTLIENDRKGSLEVHQFAKGELLIREGEKNDSIFLILEGTVQIAKRIDEETEIAVMMLQPGDVVGLISFYTEGPAFSSVLARTAVSALSFHREEFRRLADDHPDFYRQLQPVIVQNLAERYRRIVQLHVEVALLTKELESERNHLQATLEKLKQTQNRLVHQEKMATLGQLVAGVAHEINNPAASLLRSMDNVIHELPRIQSKLTKSNGASFLRFTELGLAALPSDTEQLRVDLEELELRYHRIPRSLLRNVAQLNPEGRTLIDALLKNAGSPTGMDELQTAIDCFELGIFLKTARISAERIGGLVGSLKRYSRPEKEQYEVVDIREGLNDTLLILGNRLRKVEIHKILPDIPAVRCVVGEMNQVWTNIIFNAVEAMNESGSLTVSCGVHGGNDVWVTIEDSGPGIPPDVLERVFEPNFTTKTASGKFGLGLGLAISNEIVQKHGGRIRVENAPGHGARFTVTLPI